MKWTKKWTQVGPFADVTLMEDIAALLAHGEGESDCDALCACGHMGRSHTEVNGVCPWRVGCRECICLNFKRPVPSPPSPSNGGKL
jgi:hypothetical protein